MALLKSTSEEENEGERVLAYSESAKDQPDSTETQTEIFNPIEEAALEPGMTKTLSLRERLLDIKTLAGFGISLALIVFFALTVKIDLGKIWDNISKANLVWLVAAFAIYYAAFIARGFRWRLLLQNAGFREEKGVNLPGVPVLIEIIFLSWFVNCIVPAKLGDAYRGYLLKKNANASFSRTLGTIFAERIADVLVLFGLLCVGGLIAFSKVQSKLGGISLVFVLGLGLVAVIVAGLITLRYGGDKVEQWIPARFRSIFNRFRHGTVSSFKRKTQLELYALTIIIWLCEGARLYFVLQSLHIELGLSVVIFIALTSSLLTTIPFTPAGLGAVEGVIVFVLTTFDVEKNMAGSVAVLDRVISYWSIIVFGVILYIFSKRK